MYKQNWIFSGVYIRIVAMSYIRKYKRGNSTYVQIVFKDGRRISKIIHLGTAHNQVELDVLLLKAEAIQLGEKQISLFPEREQKPSLQTAGTFSKLLYSLIKSNYQNLQFNQINDYVFQNLVTARIVEPVSKLDSIRVLEDLGVNYISIDQIYWSLRKTVRNNYRKIISGLCVQNRNINYINILLYDVTTLYFEIPREDRIRIPGLSKERRLEPQIVIGLLVDHTGFPLSLQMFQGNTAETKTIVPVLQKFQEEYKIKNLTVVADSAMLNQKNIQEIEENGFNYIIGSRQQKMPFAIEEYLKTNIVPNDLDVVEGMLSKGQRAIYQYSAKRARLDMSNIEKQIKKAEKVIAGTSTVKKSKFVKFNAEDKKLNKALIEKAKSLAGFKGYITNLSLPAERIIKYYHDLWHVEAAFRMSKHDLKARPIFHQTEESIEAHLTIVMAALAVSKLMEEKSGLSIKKIVNLLKPMRSAVLISNTDGSTLEVPPHIPQTLASLIEQLSRGY